MGMKKIRPPLIHLQLSQVRVCANSFEWIASFPLIVLSIDSIVVDKILSTWFNIF